MYVIVILIHREIWHRREDHKIIIQLMPVDILEFWSELPYAETYGNIFHYRKIQFPLILADQWLFVGQKWR